MEALKREIAQGEGALEANFKRIQKEFGVKTLDEAYALLEKSGKEREVKAEQRDELIQIANERIEGFKRS